MSGHCCDNCGGTTRDRYMGYSIDHETHDCIRHLKRVVAGQKERYAKLQAENDKLKSQLKERTDAYWQMSEMHSDLKKENDRLKKFDIA